MGSIQLVRLMFMTLALVIGSHAAHARGSSTSPDAQTSAGAFTIAKGEKEKGKAKPAPKKKPAKDKAGAKGKKKAAGKEKAAGKAKAKAKSKGKEPAKTLKAKAAPAKGGKKKAAAAAVAEDESYDDDTRSGSSDAGFWFMLALGILAVCGIGFMLWLEYRPTVYPSGKTYGQFDYLPAGRGGAFTTEYGADAMAQWNGRQKPAERSEHQPATVTREPLHSTRKTEQVPRTKESA